jgi:hypothetical protein
MAVTEEKVSELLEAKIMLIDIGEAKRRLSAKEPNTAQPHNPDRNDYLSWDGRRLELSNAEDHAFETLVKGFRNQFEHFHPHTCFINPAGFPEILTHVLRIIQFVALESHCILYNREGEEERVRQAIEGIRNKLR